MNLSKVEELLLSIVVLVVESSGGRIHPTRPPPGPGLNGKIRLIWVEAGEVAPFAVVALGRV